ncbi:hypothetical protein CE91St1_49740 [Parabacteroides goldsteinii]|nr:hypothetical protein CE91St1_49740 [Parabacteroides goldsteinii]GKG80761.1 hypothetical protein CE91St2_39530 [Parabacteroides goldsteinii]
MKELVYKIREKIIKTTIGDKDIAKAKPIKEGGVVRVKMNISNNDNSCPNMANKDAIAVF